ncbi:MAG: 1,4-dihydroxy-2-naphthoate octaprenyltransferase [Prevotella sp.]|nr:1,4-dihydroxy-2-naphthoate octaprenyltransferase [Prevotella sp.]
MEDIRTDSLKAWLLAARPKTLSGAAVPVMMALALAWADCRAAGVAFQWLPAVLCLLFAFIMQIDANFINDYFDFRKGTDDENRLGPRRACAQGWVRIASMRRVIVLTTAAACVVGLPLVFYGGWPMVLVGVLCVLFCFLYTTHLSYMGLGDVLVLVFFGLVPVCVTYFLQLHTVTVEVVVCSVACGLVIDTLLIVNNYRDRDTDLRAGKNTLVLRIGERATERLFLALGLMAVLLGVVCVFSGHLLAFVFPFIYLFLHTKTWRKMLGIKHGKALNLILAENARNMFVYGLLFAIGVLLSSVFA